MDSEKEFSNREILKLENDVKEKGINVIVIADWYSEEHLNDIHFFDQETKRWYPPETGGSNVPAINKLLMPFGISFRTQGVFSGIIFYKGCRLKFDSGSVLDKYPDHANVYFSRLWSIRTIKNKNARKKAKYVADTEEENLPFMASVSSYKGNIIVFGDSSCFQGVDPSCLPLLKDMLVDFGI